MNRILQPDGFTARLARGALLPTLLLAGVVAAILLARPSAPSAADAPPGDFSAQRAMQHVYFLAAQTRPVGSIAHGVAGNYLLEQLRDIGLETRTQDATVSYLRPARPSTSRFARVRNIIGVLPGSQPDAKALLLMAHYDSRPLTPGAGDDASGTATLLETARALSAGERLRNDVIFLFTDGEESGLFGAQAFFRDHPLAERVGTVLNFEARGSSGPMLMFQSSPGNAALLSEFSRHSQQPAGNSLADAVYRRMRNDTDFSIPLEHGLAGMNFAFVDGFFDYHSPTDTPQNLSLHSLQQAGDHALPLARRLAALDLPLSAESDRVFFNVFGAHGFVSYPMYLDGIVFLLGLFMVSAATWRAWQTKRIEIGGSLRGLVASLVLLLFPALAVAAAFNAFIDTGTEDAVREIAAQMNAWLAVWLLLATGAYTWLAARLRQRVKSLEASAVAIVMLLGFNALGLHLVVASILAIVLGIFVVLWLGDRVSIAEQHIGTLFLWTLLGIAMLLLEPAGAYLFTWPLLLTALVFGVSVYSGKDISALTRLVVALPVLTTYGFIVYFIHLALGYAQPLVTVLPLLLLAAWVSLQFPLRHAQEANWGLALIVIALAIAPWLSTGNAFDDRHPRPTQLFVVNDAVSGERFIGAGDETLSPWQQEMLGMATHREIPAHWISRDRDMHLQPLAGSPEAALSFEIISDVRNEHSRKLRLNLQATPGVTRGFIRLDDAVAIRQVRVDGEPVARRPLQAGDDWIIYWVGIPDQGYLLELDIEENAALHIDATSFRDDLPTTIDVSHRPANEMPEPYSWSDSQVFIEGFEL